MKKISFVFVSIALSTLSYGQTLQEAIKKTENEQFKQAQGDFEKLVSQSPTSIENYFFYGNMMVAAGDTTKAIDLWRKAGTLNPEDKLSQLSLSKSIYFSGDTTTAGQQFCQVIKKTKSKNAMVLHRIAETYATGKIKNLARAESLLKSSIAMDGKNVESLILMGDVIVAQSGQRISEAVAFYNQALLINPSSALLVTKKARVYQGVRNYKLANEEFLKAEGIDPNFAPAYKYHGDLNSLFKYYNEAAKLYEKYLSLNEEIEVRYSLASAYFGAKNYSKTSEELQKLEKANFVTPYTKRYKTWSAAELITDTNRISYENVLALSNDFFASAPEAMIVGEDYRYLAVIQQKLKNYDLAAESFTKGAQLDTSKINAYMNDATKMYRDLKMFDKMVAVYEKKIQMDASKMSYNDFYYLAAGYDQAKNFVKSEETYKKAITMLPNYDLTYFQLARLQNRMEDPKVRKYLAKDAYETYLVKVKPEEAEKNKARIIEANKFLGDFYYTSAKDKAKATTYWEVVRTLDPADMQAKKFFEL